MSIQETCYLKCKYIKDVKYSIKIKTVKIYVNLFPNFVVTNFSILFTNQNHDQEHFALSKSTFKVFSKSTFKVKLPFI